MSCTACNQNLEETDLMTELPCCGLVMHSKCALKFVTDASYDGMTVYCPGCSESLWSHPLYIPPSQSLSPEFLEEVKTLKPLASQYKKATREFRKVVREAKQELKTQIAPYIESIRAAKKAQKDALKASSAYKDCNKQHRSYIKHASALAEKYDVSVRAVNQQFKILWWRSNPIRVINGSLYVKI